MTFQMTQEQSNQYAQRMHDDGDWDKGYEPQLNGIQLQKDDRHGVHIALPVSLAVERHQVSPENEEEYEDRPGAIFDELAEDDQGIIQLDFILAVPFPVDPDKGIDVIKLKAYNSATMYDGQIELSDTATEHLINRLNPSYMVIDTFNQNTEIFAELVKRSETLLPA